MVQPHSKTSIRGWTGLPAFIQCAISASFVSKASSVFWLESVSATLAWLDFSSNSHFSANALCLACWDICLKFTSCTTNPPSEGAGVAFHLAPNPAVQPHLFKPAGVEAPTDAALIGYRSNQHPLCSKMKSVQSNIGSKETLKASCSKN